ncbi:MAG: hypothetical protein FWC47_15025 [Oscillospiraceae bacterium]|nr:hypothetical protein [Oscillospiraceae bacterium]
MVTKTIVVNGLILNYEYLSDDGKNLKKIQSFSFMPQGASSDDLYEVGSDISNMLKAPAKTIKQNSVFLLAEG